MQDVYLTCKKTHAHNLLILNTYHTDLYVSWSLEMAYRISRISRINCWYSDFSRYLPDRQLSFYSRFRRRVLFPKGFSESFNVIAAEQGAKIAKVKKKNVILSYIRVMRYFLLYLFVILSSKQPGDFLSSKRLPNELKKSVHSTIGGYLRSVNYLPFMHPYLMFRTIVSFSLSENLVRTHLEDNSYCQIIVGNGRLVNPAGALCAARALQIATLIVERGAKPGMLDTYLYSPHSKTERRNQLERLWMTTDAVDRVSKAIEYLLVRKKQDPISGVAWQRNMTPGFIPNWSREFSICFFTTTELEFAVFGDPIEKNEFSTQLEAITALAENLDRAKWQIFVRRHPYPGKRPLIDPEAKIWRKLSVFPHVTIIDPDSKIDSYELGNKVDLVAHFDSSIGPELIHAGKTPVVTMGPSAWEDLESDYYIRKKEEISEEHLLRLKIRPTEDIYKWALYMASFGEHFQVIEWQQGKGLYKGIKFFSRKIYQMSSTG